MNPIMHACLLKCTHTTDLQRDGVTFYRPDKRGVCVRAIGPVLCHLLDLAVRIEELCASDAYVHPHVSVVDVFVCVCVCAL